MNVIIVGYMHLNNNSGIHIFNLAMNLCSLGVKCIVFVPNQKEEVFQLGTPEFDIYNYSDLGHINFVPDIVHAWTSREVVRKFVEKLVKKYTCPYLVHMEDNEEYIVAKVHGWSKKYFAKLQDGIIPVKVPHNLSHPATYKRFIESSIGVTSLLDTLLEFKPKHLPGLVFWPAYGSAFESILDIDCALRKKFDINKSDMVVVYMGNVHHSNRMEVYSLYLSVLILNRMGVATKLVRTGRDHVPLCPCGGGELGDNYIELGYLSYNELPTLLAMADVLVQPGASNEFNDYRFPSKLPEYLISGKPVILPDTNIGRYLTDGVNAVILKRPGAYELVNKLNFLFSDELVRKRIGAEGRKFALVNFSWQVNAQRLADFYNKVIA